MKIILILVLPTKFTLNYNDISLGENDKMLELKRSSARPCAQSTSL